MAKYEEKDLRPYLETGKFEDLFLDKLGWDEADDFDSFTVQYQQAAESRSLKVLPVAQKKNLLAAAINVGNAMPNRDARKRIERRVDAHAHEHLIIFHNSDFSEQIWQVPQRKPGEAIRTKERSYTKGVAFEELKDFLGAITFTIADERELTLLDVMFRVEGAVEADTVTRKFYREFNTVRNGFVEQIIGILPEGFVRKKNQKEDTQEEADRKWYAAVMLNRLMFTWFLQEKRLLDNGNRRYLQEKLQAAKDGNLGGASFQSFYLTFLKHLFHSGFNTPEQNRDSEITKLIGEIPYINGGIFGLHHLEQGQYNIVIPDEAFDAVFSLFSRYSWHLDDRPTAKENEINPDVLGHIFEQFVNQKEKGAYYTKEDVTGYMSQNTIIPWLLDKARRDVSQEFKPGGSVWALLREKPNRYIYGSMKYGVVDKDTDEIIPLAKEIAAGADDYAKRDNWNQRATQPYALPTETWREYFHRRNRTIELNRKLAAGEVTEIDDLITLNLDIRQFMRDIVELTDSTSLIKSLWNGVSNITILDPTVGSGAFLFAAVRVLKPIASDLLEKMEDQVARAGSVIHSGSNLAEFQAILEEVRRHPNDDYFIMRQIILHNLYGVDIEEEAVEICKLRLFLLLVAHLDDPKNIEPLPDLDFNIRAGNTLVGYATRAEVDLAVKGGNASQMRLDLANNAQAIDERAEDAGKLFEKFKDIQSTAYPDVDDLRVAKQQYETKISELRAELDGYLHQQQDTGRSFEDWRTRTQPFHWFAEFHRVVIGNGGFDVVIGNPPYVSANEIRKHYSLGELETSGTPNIYAMVYERSFRVTKLDGRLALIVPISVTFGSDFKPLRDLIMPTGFLWVSTFDIRPSSLFSGAAVRCSICMIAIGSQIGVASTRLNRWKAVNRPTLMQGLEYHTQSLMRGWSFDLPRTGELVVEEFLSATSCYSGPLVESHNMPPSSSHENEIKWAKASLNFLSVYLEDPPSLDAATLKPHSSNSGSLVVRNSHLALAILAGEAFMVHWWARSDGLNVPSWTISTYLDTENRLDIESVKHLMDLGSIMWERRNDVLAIRHHAARYIGNYNYRQLHRVTRRADLLLMYSLGMSADSAVGLLDFAQRVLLVNENAGQRVSPPDIKALFPSNRPVEMIEEHHTKLQEIDHFLCLNLGLTKGELESILSTGYPQWPSLPD